MRTETFEKTLKGFTERIPFRPFTVELINGRQFAINHPAALVVRSDVAVYIDPDGALVIFDHAGVNQFTGTPEPQITSLCSIRIEEIRRALAEKPFRPFFVITGSGRRYRVAGPEHIGFSPCRRRMLVWHEDDSSSPVRTKDIVV